jgi:hypothetical protein
MPSDPLPGAKEHIETARELAARIDDIPADTPRKPIARVGVLGAGSRRTSTAASRRSARTTRTRSSAGA